jgi:hypothetical protein
MGHIPLEVIHPFVAIHLDIYLRLYLIVKMKQKETGLVRNAMGTLSCICSLVLQLSQNQFQVMILIDQYHIH